jgi:surface protein
MDLISQRMMMGSSGSVSNEPMVLVFDTSLGDASNTISLPLYGSPMSVVLDWGDGTTDIRTTEGNFSHTYATSGIYTVKIYGFLARFGSGTSTYPRADALIRVEDFGDIGIVSLQGAFRNAINLTSVPSTLPDSVTNLSYCFFSATNFNDSNITSWDTSRVTDMSRMFYDATNFNQNIGNWNVSSVITFFAMFFNAFLFNQNIGNWNTSSSISFSYMFYGASSFNQDIGNWNTSNAFFMNHMFAGASSFNNNNSSSINNWNTSRVTNMSFMFYDAYTFNQPINSWDVSNVTNMSAMFYATDLTTNFHLFNRPLIGWNTSKVINMSFMFRGALAFNQEIGSWDVSNVTNMQAMFFAAGSFNQDIGNWDVSSVTNMTVMFAAAISFNQDLSRWCVSNFATKPTDWDTGANSAWIAKPVWGTCPLDQYNLTAFFDPDTIYGSETGLLPDRTKLKWTGQNIQSLVFYQLYNLNGTEVVTTPNSSTTGESFQNITASGIVTNNVSWLAGKVIATSTIDGSEVVAYARINVLSS